MEKSIIDRIAAMRDFLRENGLAAYIVPSTDPHSSEYVADCWKAREWLSGFDGSAGTVVVTLDSAALWTDSRYWLAAEEQLAGSGIILMKDGLDGTPGIVSWVADRLSFTGVVGVDGKVCTVSEVEAWRDEFAAYGIRVDASRDAFAEIWDTRPALPMSRAEIMPLDRAGECAHE